MIDPAGQAEPTTICSDVMNDQEIRQETWKFFDLIPQTNTNEVAITWLAKHRLISNCVKCSTCSNLCTLVDHPEDIDGKRWKCDLDSFTQSVRIGSIFEDSDVSLTTFIWLMYMWSREHLNSEIAHETKVNVNTIDDLCQYIRELLEGFLEDHPTELGDDPPEIGGFDSQTGKPKVVEIDVTTISKPKPNGKKHVKGYKVFGGIERGSEKCFLVPIEHRNKEAFEAAIVRWVLPGTHIVSGVWAEYLQISQIQQGIYTHDYINLIERDSENQTSDIDRMWLRVKGKLRRKHLTSDKAVFQSLLAEFIWRSHFKKDNKFAALIYCITHLYKV
ncbi:uncharacterized protein LOC115214311 [Octopus sinensis]|uniref:Uncharacterized protein LOC115214311 n=1 Tax=Octopus sinensis TaxID=2607531 RepID=A0A6P7SMT2_9MOLL|nr:uncharacterized protein LOC115214311 [Octopus sinensis]